MPNFSEIFYSPIYVPILEDKNKPIFFASVCDVTIAVLYLKTRKETIEVHTVKYEGLKHKGIFFNCHIYSQSLSSLLAFQRLSTCLVSYIVSPLNPQVPYPQIKNIR